MAALIVVVAGTVLLLAFREVQSTLLAAAAIRTHSAADQIASLLAQSTQQRLLELRTVANDDVLRSFVEHPSDDARPAAVARLSKLSSPSPQVIELWNASGQRIFSLATPATAASLLPVDARAPTAAGISRLQTYHESLITEAATEVTSSGSAHAPGSRLGFLVVRRPAVLTTTADVLNRLVGVGASVKIGNRTGSGWTDLSKVITAPPLEHATSGSATYRTADGDDRLGAFAAIAGTPWAVWVDFSLTDVLAPSRAFLRRMIAIVLLVVVLATGLVYVMSARITTPLSELTHASEAMAEDGYSRRVAIVRSDEIGRLGIAFNAMSDRVERAHHELEARVQQRTAKLEEASRLLSQHVQELKDSREELVAVNRELEAFSYSVSHDLRAPLRHVSGFAALLTKSASESLSADSKRLLKTIVDAASRMGCLIDDLLGFSRIGRAPLTRSNVSLDKLLQEARDEISAGIPPEAIVWRVNALPTVSGDPALLRLVLVNLLSNAAKYSASRSPAEIEVGTVPTDAAETVLFVRDNGVGFDMQYEHKLFGVFQRLHTADEFEGTGIGLANVKRIVHRHGGRVWAESAVGRGATFFVALPSEGASPDLTGSSSSREHAQVDHWNRRSGGQEDAVLKNQHS
jgi:signal transduction histidine kinase